MGEQHPCAFQVNPTARIWTHQLLDDFAVQSDVVTVFGTLCRGLELPGCGGNVEIFVGRGTVYCESRLSLLRRYSSLLDADVFSFSLSCEPLLAESGIPGACFMTSRPKIPTRLLLIYEVH